MDIENFIQNPVMGIARGIKEEQVEPLLEALISAGLGAFEITMNTEAASDIIYAANKWAGVRMAIGAGTVLSLDSAKEAIDHGASFIVMPVFKADIVEYCVKNKIPVFPGALTPQEIYDAWSAGASMVKVFPAKLFGPGYFKEVKAPLNDVKLLACGGVSDATVADYFANGADAVAFGSSILKQDLMDSGRFDIIEEKVKTLIQARVA